MPRTVFVTGASGFIAKHIVLELLKAGNNVRGSVRSPAKADEVRAAMVAHLGAGADLDTRLSLVELDLTSDRGWETALGGVDALVHTASPFPAASPRDENDLIRPAVDGTLRALRAAHAAKIRRVVVTSSVAAIYAKKQVPDVATYDESDWTDPESPAASTYVRSKTLAERAAWDYVDDAGDIALTTINPSLVLGPPLDGHFGTSLDLVRRILSGKDPALPRLGLEIVDVRDIARMHVAALNTPESEGKRVIGSAGFMWLGDMAEFLKSSCPERRITTRQAPNWFIRLFALFDSSVRTIVPVLGKRLVTDNSRARTLFDMSFLPVEDSLRASADYLISRETKD